MNAKSLFKIKSIFKALNDKLAFLQDPQTYAYAKRKLDPKKVQDDVNQFVSEEQDLSKQQKQINKDVDKRLNYLEQAIKEVSEKQANPIEASPIQNNIVAEPVQITDEKLEEIGIKYNPEAKRYQQIEKNEKGRKDFVSYENVLKKLKEAEPAQVDDEYSLLNSINDNLISANNSLESILKLLTDKPAVATTENKQPDATPETEDDEPDKRGGGMGGIWEALGFTLFAFAPFLLVMAKNFLDKYRKKISDFLEPIFKFVLEDVPNFFTETIPTFFTETLPDFFSEKFNSVKDLLADFMDNITQFMASIKKGVGSALVTVGDLLPGDIGKSISDYGKKMIEEADTSSKEAEDRKQARQDERDKKEKFKLLKDQAEEEAKKFIENNKGKYDKYTIKQDEKSGYTIITYKGPDSEKMVFFDTAKSLETGTLVHVKPKDGKKDVDAVSEPQSTPTAPGKDNEPVKSDTGGGGSDASVVAPTGGGGSGGGTSDAADQSGGGGSPTAAGGSGSEVGGGSSGGDAASAAPAAEMQPAPEENAAGDKLTKGSMEATAPIEPTAQTQGTNVINAGGANKTAPKVIEGKPHDISDVPDPTPVLGFLAEQLFYLKA